jgi:hypothetical protein
VAPSVVAPSVVAPDDGKDDGEDDTASGAVLGNLKRKRENDEEARKDDEARRHNALIDHFVEGLVEFQSGDEMDRIMMKVFGQDVSKAPRSAKALSIAQAIVLPMHAKAE